jgi:hypothetical protein
VPDHDALTDDVDRGELVARGARVEDDAGDAGRPQRRGDLDVGRVGDRMRERQDGARRERRGRGRAIAAAADRPAGGAEERARGGVEAVRRSRVICGGRTRTAIESKEPRARLEPTPTMPLFSE